jgi:hypothetical protein
MNERPNNDQQKDHSKYLERYALLIGKLVVNFQGLELLLRTFLQEQPGAQRPRLSQGETIFSPPVGSIVDLCPLTDWDTLGMLIGFSGRNYPTISGLEITRPRLSKTLDKDSWSERFASVLLHAEARSKRSYRQGTVLAADLPPHQQERRIAALQL